MAFYLFSMKSKQDSVAQAIGRLHRHSMSNRISWRSLKGLLQGFRFSATVASKELMDQWPLGTHGTTFGGNPFACSAALASLEVMKEEKLLENATAMGAYAMERLLEMKDNIQLLTTSEVSV